jgi:hypothetical protein
MMPLTSLTKKKVMRERSAPKTPEVKRAANSVAPKSFREADMNQ